MKFVRQPSISVTRGVFIGSIAIWLSGCATSPYADFADTRSQSTAQYDAPPIAIKRDRATENELGPLIGAVARAANIPGVAAAVLQGDRVVAEGIAGVRRKGSAEPVTIDDNWEIASCAKAMAAMAIARLVEAGVVDWDQPIQKYFPGEILGPDWDHVTLRQLVSHTAGVRDPIGAFLETTYFDHGSLSEQRYVFVRKVLHGSRRSDASPRVKYNNTDYIIAAVVAERTTHTPWEQLLTNLVFAPLGLGSAGFGPPGEPRRLTQPWGHGKIRVFQLPLIGSCPFDPGSPSADYPAMASPAGYVHVSLRDWEEFVALHLRGDRSNPHRRCVILPSETFDALHALRPGVGYAGGWYVDAKPWAKGPRPTDRGRVLYHLGNNGRWTSAVWVAPEIDFAVLVVCNDGDKVAAVDEIVSQLVGRYAHLGR